MRVQTAKAVADNLRRVMLEYDLTTRDLADRAGLPQKTISAMMNGDHNFRLDTLHKVCKALLIDEGTLMRPRVPMNVLMSRRLPRLIDKYCRLMPEDRERVEMFVDAILNGNAGGQGTA